MAAFDDLDDVSMDERQVETFRTLSKLFDELAGLAEKGLPSVDQAAHEDALGDITTITKPGEILFVPLFRISIVTASSVDVFGREHTSRRKLAQHV